MTTAKMVIDVMNSWVGKSRAKGTHKDIIDLYNSYKPLARGYKMKYTDEYCDATVSACFIKLGAVDLIGGTECGVEKHVQKFIKKGIWLEDGNIKPLPGDIIVFNWDDNTQPNNGNGDHIGIVEKVVGDKITCIEGNMNGGVVGKRTINVGWGYIRGFARPKYDTAMKSNVEVAKEVLEGKWGNGAERKEKLTKAGYNYAAVQNEVNKLVKKTKPLEVIAKEVIEGKWGNGALRKQRLKEAGYNPVKVQELVNKML